MNKKEKNDLEFNIDDCIRSGNYEKDGVWIVMKVPHGSTLVNDPDDERTDINPENYPDLFIKIEE